MLPGPRGYQWQPLAPATLVWAEALDNGDPKTKVPHRDKVVAMSRAVQRRSRRSSRAPSIATATSRGPTAARAADRERSRAAMDAHLGDRQAGRDAAQAVGSQPGGSYGNPGTPQRTERASGASTIEQSGDAIFLSGNGASPEGARPFLDRLNLTTLKTERLFQTTGRSYETVVGVLSDDGSKILTRYESRTEPPNVYVRDLKAGTRRALTSYTDPAPQLQGIQKQLVTYKRSDGVELSATLITPPGWTPAQGPLPTLLWAYPREFTDPDQRRPGDRLRRSLHLDQRRVALLFLTQGYAIIDDPTMPIVGPGETANDTYVQQLVASAQAAVDKRGQPGRHRSRSRRRRRPQLRRVHDREPAGALRHLPRRHRAQRRLQPHADAVRLPERAAHVLGGAADLRCKMSPFNYAHKINEPILLIHGEADDNSGTFPIQSERLYMALKGHGATVRYVTLP